MRNVDYWVLASFICGLIPVLALSTLYGVKTKWTQSNEGRALLISLLVAACSYLISISVILFPQVFLHGFWYMVRNVARFALAGVLWNMLRIFLRAQRDGRRRDDR